MPPPSHDVQEAPSFDALLARARALAGGGRRALLGIAGSPGAGKTTLAERLVSAVNGDGDRARAAHVPMDGFHLADVELDRLGLRHRKGAPETFDAAGYAALLRRLRDDDGDLVYAPGFERVLEQPIAGAIPVPPAARLVVTEGNYLLLGTGAWSRVRPCLDEVWFCAMDEDERLRRLVARHERFGKSHEEAVAWVLRSDQPNADLVAATRDRADLVVTPGEWLLPATD
ncbi:nucleoside/nucleotide kinase family protein [Streptomyces mangrovisoli]|uniref:Nucleoside/nucleotide kinase family protein n=1 Tax=Streptomyces mangrovisoli TaxID=1428628 RepID=A0A1J4P2J1_9ACTN|nr:nucleoside/nucleotide kinase family protein [Streptomyces mangrovisoli]